MKQEFRIARIYHLCYACSRLIPPGHKYVRTAVTVEGKSIPAKFHESCEQYENKKQRNLDFVVQKNIKLEASRQLKAKLLGVVRKSLFLGESR